MEPLGKNLKSIDKLVKTYLVLLTVLMFAGFPLAVFIPNGYGFNIYKLVFPAFLLSAGFSAALLLMLRKGEKKFSPVEISLAVIFLSFLISTVINGSSGAEFLKYSGVVFLPLSIALSYRVLPDFTKKTLIIGISVLWLINIIHAYHRLPSINNVGMAGNRNWLSALILASAPLAALALKALLSKFMKDEKTGTAVSLLVVILVSIPVLMNADSRATYVAVMAVPVYVLFVLFGRKVKMAIGALLIIGLIAVPIAFKKQIEKENTRNIRLPLWGATLNMVKENPLGVGPDNFEYKFPEYVSSAQKRMMVSAETTVHPHNEFLFMTASGGIAAGIGWLVLLSFALLSRQSSREDFYFTVPLLILFIQGMMDKPLHQMPTMQLFYLLLGFVIGRKELLSLNLKKPDREKLSLYKVVATVVCLAFAFFAFKNTASSWFERKAAIAEQKGEKDQAFDYYKKSFDYANWRLFPAYKAFIISTINNPDPIKAIDFYDAIEERAPDYRQFNLLKGKFFTQLAMQDRDNLKEHLENAWKSYNRACELNETNILSFIDRMKFASRFLPVSELDKSYGDLVNVYRFKSDAGAKHIDSDLKNWGREWLQLKSLPELLQKSSYLGGVMKPAFITSQYYPADMSPLLRSLGGPYNLDDMAYAKDAKTILTLLPLEGFEGQIKHILDNVEVSSTKKFSWPVKSLKEKQCNKLSRLCLLAMVARLNAFEPFILFEDNVIFLMKGNSFFQIGGEGLKSLEKQEISKLMTNKKFHFFDYPQGFFYKNELMAHLLSEAGATPLYNRNTDYVIGRFVKLFRSYKIKLEIVKEPFADLINRSRGL